MGLAEAKREATRSSYADGRSLRIGPTDKLDSDRWCTAHESTFVELSMTVPRLLQQRASQYRGASCVGCGTRMGERAR